MESTSQRNDYYDQEEDIQTYSQEKNRSLLNSLLEKISNNQEKITIAFEIIIIIYKNNFHPVSSHSIWDTILSS